MKRALIAVVSLLAAFFVAAPDAMAGPPSRALCTRNDNYVQSCFDAYNDTMWVYDAEHDGASAAVKWRTAAGGSGTCINSAGYGQWRTCDYNMAERYTSGDRNCANIVYWDNWTVNRSATPDDWNYISGTYNAYVQYNPQPCTISV